MSEYHSAFYQQHKKYVEWFYFGEYDNTKIVSRPERKDWRRRVRWKTPEEMINERNTLPFTHR